MLTTINYIESGSYGTYEVEFHPILSLKRGGESHFLPVFAPGCEIDELTPLQGGQSREEGGESSFSRARTPQKGGFNSPPPICPIPKGLNPPRKAMRGPRMHEHRGIKGIHSLNGRKIGRNQARGGQNPPIARFPRGINPPPREKKGKYDSQSE